MLVVEKENIYGITVYQFFTSQGVPYQLTFEADLSGRGIGVNLLNLLATEGEKLDLDIREAVCWCFRDYIRRNTQHKIYFELELQYSRNLAKLRKFLSWANRHPEITTSIEVIKYKGEIFAEVIINA